MNTKWKPIRTAPHNKFVLTARRSGYVGIDWWLETAQFTAGWHDRWDDIAGDVMEPSPLFWTELPNLPED
jgi:hypothetical protein